MNVLEGQSGRPTQAESAEAEAGEKIPDPERLAAVDAEPDHPVERLAAVDEAPDHPVERLAAADAAATRTAGLRFAERLVPGDLVILSGELGAGKTTFTQGLAEGLGVRGPITSPTFVLARVHPSLVGGPSLVHVDAYRLGSLAELDDLDLDASFDESVTVVEWGEGKAEVLAEGRSGHYLVRLDRSREDDVREILISRA